MILGLISRTGFRAFRLSLVIEPLSRLLTFPHLCIEVDDNVFDYALRTLANSHTPIRLAHELVWISTEIFPIIIEFESLPHKVQ